MTESAVMNTYGDRNTTLVKGQGAYVWDANNRRYLDALSGIAVVGLGHCHPAITKAICEQANTLLHCSNLYIIEPQQALGRIMIERSGMDKIFFSNSGAEANEAAIKIARKYGNDKGIHAPEIITAWGSFHGRTMATLSATGAEKVKQGFEPLLPGFCHVDYNDIAAIENAATPNTVAVMVEPVQGEGGIRVPDEDYIVKLRALCDRHGWLLILDEIQSGNGRTGTLFAYQHTAILPDVVTTAKGLANGAPIGACLARGLAAEVLQPGNHGSTFGGNPLACSAALAVMNTLDATVLDRVASLGSQMRAQFSQKLADNPHLVEIRGKGLMIGIELDRDCGPLVEHAKSQGILINVTAGSTVRLLPPFIIDDQEASTIVETISQIINEFTQDPEE